MVIPAKAGADRPRPLGLNAALGIAVSRIRGWPMSERGVLFRRMLPQHADNAKIFIKLRPVDTHRHQLEIGAC